MVPVGMGEEHDHVEAAPLDERLAKAANAGASVDDDGSAIIGADFQAGRIPAVAIVLRP